MSTRAKENANHSQTKLIHVVTEQILQRKSYKMMALCVENYLPVRGMQAETTRTPENANPSQAKLILFVTEQILQKKKRPSEFHGSIFLFVARTYRVQY